MANPVAVEPFVGDLQVHTWRLDNGLVIKVVPDRSAPVVAVQTWMGVGSADLPPHLAGLPHLFEHLMFKGTEVYEDGEFSAILESLGADGLNAWTWLDQTVYTEAVPTEVLPTVLDLESARLHRLALDEAVFRSELEVVMNERRLVVDNDPGGRLGEQLLDRAFRVHPYGRPTIGWMHDLEKLTLDDAVAFYRSFYAPDNATLVIVGDVDPSEVVGLVEGRYGALPPGGASRVPRPVEPPPVGSRVEETLPIASDRVLIALHAPAYTDADMPALLALDAALTAGETGRLVRALRDTGVVLDVGGGVLPLRDPTIYELSLQCRPGVSAEVAEEALWRELERVARDGVSEGELAMGIAQWRAAGWARLEDAMGKADFLGWALAHTGSHLDGLARLDAIQRVTVDDARRVAAAVLRRDTATVVVGRAAEPSAPVAVAPPVVEPADRTVPVARAHALPAPVPKHETVERTIHGATVLIVRDDTLPLVWLRLHLPVGHTAARPGVANLAARLIPRGTKRRSRRAFEEALEQLGASFSVSVDGDGVHVGGRCLADAWPAWVELVAEALREPAFEVEELERLRAEVEAELEAVADDDGELASLALWNALFGPEHPYGQDPRGRRGALAGITRDELVAWHAGCVRAGGAILGISGRLDRDFLDDLDRLLGGIAGDPVAVPEVPPIAAVDGVRVVLVDKPDRTQAQVSMACLVDRDGADFPAFVLCNDGLGAGFQGRLMKEVRVQRGWSYFAYSYAMPLQRACPWVAVMAPGHDHAIDAIDLVLRILADVGRDGLTEEELEQARGARVNGRPFLVDTAAKRLDLALQKRRTGYDRLAVTEAIETVAGDEARGAFAARVSPGRIEIVVVSTEAVLGDALRERFKNLRVVPYTQVVG